MLVGNITLHKYQIVAVKWMIEREEFGGGLLCDEMGLGKTLTTIRLLLEKPVPNTLILLPLPILDQWITVLQTTFLALYKVVGGKWKYISGNPANGSVYITNYDKLTIKHLFTNTWNRLICDEAHTIRNYMSKKYISLKTLQFEFKWFLTGTPIVNRIEDLGSLIHLIKKSISPKKIQKDVALNWMNENALQRTVEQIRTTLPGVLPPTIVHNYHRLEFISEEEAIFYRGIQGHITQALEHIMAQDRMDMIMFLAMITRLRQLSTHPQVYIQARRRQLGSSYLRTDWKKDSTKTEAIVKILEKEQKPCGYVIFCHFNDEIDVIQKRLEMEGHRIFVYNGDLSPAQRTNVIEETKKSILQKQPAYILDEFTHLPELPEDVLNYVIGSFIGYKHTILLAQIQSAGTGLNLQHMDRVIFTSPWWTAALMDQAVGRVVRMGQKNKVQVHHISLKEEELSINIDDYINERVEIKRDLCLEVLTAANHSIE